MTAHQIDRSRSIRAAVLSVPIAFGIAGIATLLLKLLALANLDTRWAIVFWPLGFLLLLAVAGRRQRIDELDLLTAFCLAACTLIAGHLALAVFGIRFPAGPMPANASDLSALFGLLIQGSIWLLGYLLLSYVWLRKAKTVNKSENGNALAS